jgi:hypothetical protein
MTKGASFFFATLIASSYLSYAPTREVYPDIYRTHLRTEKFSSSYGAYEQLSGGSNIWGTVLLYNFTLLYFAFVAPL